MQEPVWLETADIIAAHEGLIEQFGGSHGVRDHGLLQSALERPKNLFFYSDSEVALADMAAAYAYGLAKNHAFIDGNKRIALAACDGFLYLNGHDLQAKEEDVYMAVINLAAGDWDEADFAQWLAAEIAEPG